MASSISVPNAGLVLLNNFFQMLFERLGLLENAQFSSEDAQKDAVLYLQFLASGQSYAEEFFLPLNKVLCGLPVSAPVATEISISEADKELLEGLLSAAISHWTAIGESTIEGFRGNWLVRDGILREEENHFELIVEKRVYDILLNQSPFSFSIIKFPWMAKSLMVSWTY
ncbi:MAG: hypothetical protein DWQ02_22040 [Bacteroidetes bacterium]|nr:MAG: hypothetical protein DWQ02_22040 [Bacteroidota bacterium]